MVWRDISCLHHPFNISKVGFTTPCVGKETPDCLPSFCFPWIPNGKLPWYYYSLPSIRSPCIVNNYLVRTIPPPQHPRCPSLVNPFLVASCSARMSSSLSLPPWIYCTSLLPPIIPHPKPKSNPQCYWVIQNSCFAARLPPETADHISTSCLISCHMKPIRSKCLAYSWSTIIPLCIHLPNSCIFVSYRRSPGSIPYPVAGNPGSQRLFFSTRPCHGSGR